MKNNILVVFLIVFFPLFGFAQQTLIKGSVLDGITTDPIPDVIVIIEETKQTTKTNAKGEFTFTDNIPFGELVLKIEKVGYVTKRYPIVVNEGQTVDITGMTLDYNQSDKNDLFIISISDDNLNSEDDALTDNVSGLLQASRDVFLNAAAFDFSAAFFRPRGLDNANGKVLINGVEMNKQFNGRPQWGNWGGLNDVQRNQEFSMGTSANDYTFGDLAGTNNILMRASKYRKGGRISYASANRSYQGRIMASYNSGLLKGGWSYSVLASRRFGEEGYIDGTLYDANSFFVAVEKQLSEKHSLNFTGIYARNRRGRSTAITQEIFDLKGRRYNPFWGMQNGEQRNSRERVIEEPILMLNHYWDISPKVKLNNNLAYQFGEVYNTRIDFNGTRLIESNGELTINGGARNPSPVYWQNLPSFYLRGQSPSPYDYQQAFAAQQGFVDNGQLDWNKFYTANQINDYSVYALQADVTKDQQWSINSILDAELSDQIRLNANMSYRRLNSENFARINDLFGGAGFLDVDAFFEDTQQVGVTAAQSNIRTPNRIAQEGNKYRYHYDINAEVLSSFVQAQFKYNKVDFYIGGNISRTTYQREGFFENGYFPNGNSLIIGSFGNSEQIDFTNFGIKGGLTYKITGKHLIDINGSYFTKAPNIRSSFANPRQNNLIVNGLESETIQAVDASYIFRSSNLKARLTGYYTNFSNGANVNFFFSQGGAGLLQENMTNIDRRNFGAELGIEAQVTPTIKLKGVASMGQFSFTNNPNVYYSTDAYSELSFDDGTTNLKDLRVSSGPERAFQLGFEYRDPDFWNFGMTTNFFSHVYVSPSALRRSGFFSQDPEAYNLSDGPESIIATDEDGIINVSGYGVANYDEDLARQLLKQERFDDYMLVNLTGGKSWRVGDYLVGFFATINNVLDKTYRTGGFEQSRRTDYLGQIEEQNNAGGRIFGNRYWFGNGTTYYLNVYLRF